MKFKRVIKTISDNAAADLNVGLKEDNMEQKINCQECGWHGLENELLSASNPFDVEDTIFACPECKIVESTIVNACDEPGCWSDVSCGTPTPEGYRSTCGKHQPNPPLHLT